jgi:uncharacterized protein (DUF2147 family)
MTLMLGGWAWLCPTGIAAINPGPDPAEGMWFTADHAGAVKIARCGPALCGWIAWIDVTRPPPEGSGPPSNPPAINGHVLCGLEILREFRPAGDDPWQHGMIYNPVDGRSWRGELTVDGSDTLLLRGYLLVPLLGATQSWKRVPTGAVTPCRV